MAIAVMELTGAFTRNTIATTDNFEAAKAFVNTSYDVVYMEDDSDHENCADAYLRDGRLICIQPENFKLSIK